MLKFPSELHVFVFRNNYCITLFSHLRIRYKLPKSPAAAELLNARAKCNPSPLSKMTYLLCFIGLWAELSHVDLRIARLYCINLSCFRLA